MGFSIKSIRSMATSTAISVTLATTVFCINTAQAATVDIANNNPGHLSTLQVKDAVKKIYKGRIIYSKRTSKRGYPNCHVIKMITTTGEFKYIRYACS